MTRAVLAAILAVALLASSHTPAAAGGVKVIVGGGQVFHPGIHQFQQLRPLHRPPIAAGILSPSLLLQPHTHIVVVPRPVVILASPACSWTPGYWTYQWIPQSYASQSWVPGGWSPDGTWIEGHFELQAISAGYYQPAWVPASCVPY